MEFHRAPASRTPSEQPSVAPHMLCPLFVDMTVWMRIQYFSRIRKVVAYIGTHLNEPLDLDQLSLIGCMERTSLSKLFKSRTGLTLRDFIGSYHISKAVSLMEASDFSVTEVAYEVGFGSVRTFERTFKRVTGVAPSAFRSAALRRMGLAYTHGGLRRGTERSSESIHFSKIS